MDLLTNLAFSVDEFDENVPALKFTKDASYAPIRSSYHPDQDNKDDLIKKVK